MVSINLKGQVAIVTGAGRGIGRSIALKLAEAGADVMICDVVRENAEKVAEEVKKLGVKSKAYQANVGDADEMFALVDSVVKEFGSIDIMVNNAGINVIKRFVDSDVDSFSSMIDINLKGVYNGCKAAAKYMAPAKSGKIVNTASVAGLKCADYHTMYCATKFGVIGMTQTIAKELGSVGIRANCICPGIVRTDMWEQNLRELVVGEGEEITAARNAAFDQNIANLIPLDRPQTPEDMANGVLFLCSDMACNITGIALAIDGGQMLG